MASRICFKFSILISLRNVSLAQLLFIKLPIFLPVAVLHPVFQHLMVSYSSYTGLVLFSLVIANRIIAASKAIAQLRTKRSKLDVEVAGDEVNMAY